MLQLPLLPLVALVEPTVAPDGRCGDVHVHADVRHFRMVSVLVVRVLKVDLILHLLAQHGVHSSVCRRVLALALPTCNCNLPTSPIIPSSPAVHAAFSHMLVACGRVYWSVSNWWLLLCLEAEARLFRFGFGGSGTSSYWCWCWCCGAGQLLVVCELLTLLCLLHRPDGKLGLSPPDRR